jgi:hypothetical protein
VHGASVNQRVSKDPDGLLPSADQQVPTMAYNPNADNTLVAWQDHGHYSEVEVGYWGIWGRIWAPVERVMLPLILKSWP